MIEFRRLFQGIGKTKAYAALGRALAPMDRALMRATRGKIGVGTAVGVRTLLLTTVGRHSGEARQVPLVFVRHGNGLLVVGSNWGGERHPAWTGNLLATPDATAAVDGRTVPVRGRLLDGDERARAWLDIVAYWPAYNTYASRAGQREIRVFLLEPGQPAGDRGHRTGTADTPFS
ncbi:nitroreductase family deazaflavin-dependent oxidoreductase [Kutzneria sp. CA-103260]|uniref:nitroreductase family deazaflavin-dependent oxidoreductase n=1 Tax=Kutzneria sp. CA-103260 TaxID=2802641 RepID=UPI001BEE9758|nr:nitroreductase family deazaflavin-dependent oxidoreductase [Kutzneria sp. CA-103260]QUQ66277.1 nitroreductase family deazaflavin-dependent oxidoreductase [Kutzneria sp. CA-103260]